jgi:serine/threonine protein kinase
VATQYDIAFFKIAIYNKVTDQATASRCLQYIEQAAQQGRTVSAPEALQSTGANQSVIAQLNTLTQGALKQQGTAAAPQPSSAAPQPSSAQASAPTESHRASTMGSQRSSAASAPGSQIQFKEKIGAGPCGPIYHGLDRSSGQKLILKILSSKFSKHPKYLQQIVGDIRKVLGAELKHDCIVSTHTLFERDKRLIVVHEPARGTQLSRVIEEYGALPPMRSVKLAIQVARALDHAHSKGVSHGDLRPEKLYVAMKTGGLQVADFGFARASALIHGFARIGVPFGHPDYLAPEVVQQKPNKANIGHDLYSLGITLYELVCGQRPFTGKDSRETLGLHFKAPLPKPADDIYLHRKLVEALMKLTAKTPEKRLQSASQAVDLLTALTHLDLEASAESAELRRESAMSKADWENVSSDAATRSREWTEDKFRAGNHLESDEWNPDDEEDDPDWEEIVKSRRSTRQSRTNSVRETSLKSGRQTSINSNLQDLAEAIAEKDVDKNTGKIKGEAKESERKAAAALHKLGKKGAAGNRFDLVGDKLREQQEKTQKLWGFLIGASVAFFAIIALSLGFSTVKTPKPLTSTNSVDNGEEPDGTADVVSNRVAPVPPEIKAALSKSRNEALQKLKSELKLKQAKRDWPGALVRLRNFPAYMRKDKTTNTIVKEMEDAIIRLARGELDRTRAKVRKLLGNDEYRMARAELNKVKKRLISMTYPTYQELDKKILKTLNRIKKAPKITVDKLSLKGWQQTFPKLLFGDFGFKDDGTVVASYDFTSRTQKQDFKPLSKKVNAGTKEAPGLYVDSAKAPLLLLFSIPVKSIEECEFTYEITDARSLGKKSEIAFAFAVDRFTASKGQRLTNDGRAISFVGERATVRRKTSKKRSRFKPWKDKGSAFKIRRNGEMLTLTVNNQRVLRYPVEDMDGRLGLYFANVKVKIRKLKIAFKVDKAEVAQFAKEIGKKRKKRKKRQ